MALTPWKDVRPTEEGFEALGADPQMLWSPNREERQRFARFRAVRVTVGVEVTAGLMRSPCVYVDWGDSFSDETRYPLVEGPQGLTVVATSNAGALRRLRFDPSDGACCFRVRTFSIEPVETLHSAPPRLSLPRRLARRLLRRAPPKVQAAARGTRRFLAGPNSYRRKVLNRWFGSWLGSDLWRANYQRSFAIARRWRSAHYAAPPIDQPRRADGGPRVVAFYLPQYHPIPENDAWWGPGFTEWANVSKATPQFSGHYQPRLPGDFGYYDLRVPETLQAQANLAARIGVDAFCFHYYWFAGQRLLERPLNSFVEDPSISLPFALSWANENWTRRWDGAENDVLIGQRHSPEDDVAVFDDIARYLASPRYLRVGGRPLVVIYRPDILPNAADTTARWRDRARSLGHGELFLACTNAFGFMRYRETGFDALVEFPPHAIASGEITDQVELLNPSFGGRVYDYPQVAAEKIYELGQRSDPRYLPGIMPAWDNEARKPGAGHVFHNASPESFADWAETAFDTSVRLAPPSERLVFVNAWNEWAEGAYLEADRWYGHAFGYGVRAAHEQLAPQILTDHRLLRGRGIARPRRTAVALLHLYYPELIEEFGERLDGVSDLLDVVVTFNDRWSSSDVERLARRFPAAMLIPTANRGRDIAPFIQSFHEIGDKWPLFVKLHSKRSPHIADGDGWRAALVGPLTDPQTARQALTRFESNPQLGLLAAPDTLMRLGDPDVLVNNRDRLDGLAKQLGFAYDEQTPFVAGSMFWGRTAAFVTLTKAAGMSFERELGRIDGGLAHAFERAFPAIVQSAGYTAEFDV